MISVEKIEKKVAHEVEKIRKSFLKWPLVVLFGLAGFSSLGACVWAIYKGLEQTFGL